MDRIEYIEQNRTEQLTSNIIYLAKTKAKPNHKQIKSK